MPKNENFVADPSQVSAACQDNSPSAFLHGSKLRNKLEKLAQWRIDPSLIEFPTDSREISGGFAKVSRGLLSASSQAEGGTKRPENITVVHCSESGNLQSGKDFQEPEGNHQSKYYGADGRTADDDNDHANGEGRNDNDEQQGPYDQSPIPRTGDGSGVFKYIVDEDPDLDNRNAQSKSGIQEAHDDEQDGKDDGPDLQKAKHNDDQTKDEARKEVDSTSEKHHFDHPSKPKIVAVKKLKIEADTDLERALGLALRESGFLIQLSHPNIVKLERFVEDLPGHKVWLIFPWEEHGNLRDFLASGEWEIPERISLIHDVTLGLEYLHSQDPPIYHGDLKSLNILVNSGCEALITDFGSARHLENDRVGKRPKGREDLRPAIDPSTAEECITLEALFSATASTLTLTGSSYTLRWAAPELLQDDRPCLRSDIWSLGWIAYEVMTNTIPFHDVKKDAMVINRVIQGHLPSVTEDARMSLIRALCSLMVQCWSMNPDKRPSAEECRKLISWMPMIVPAPTQGLGDMYKKQGDYLNAYDCFIKASNIYTISDDSSGKVYNLRSLAELHLFRREYTEALSIYTEVLQIHTEMDDQKERASAIFGLAEVRRFQRKYDEAKTLYSECLKIYTDIDLKRSRATSLLGLASVHHSQGESSVAERLYLEVLEITTDIGDRASTGRVFWNLGEVLRARGEYGEATKRYSEALEIRTEIGDIQGRATALWGLAEVHTGRRKYNEAIKLFSEATDIFTDIGDKYWRAEALMSLARSHRMQAHHSEAISYYEEASKDLEEIGDRRRAAAALKRAAELRQALE